MMRQGTWREPLGLTFLLALSLVPVTWVGLNAGPWNLTTISSLASRGGLRALGPLIAFLVGGLLLWITRRADRTDALRGPLGALLAYGGIALVAGLLMSPDRATSLYWGLSFLAVPLAALVVATSRSPDLHLRIVTRMTAWIVLAIAVIILGVAIWFKGLGDLLAAGDLRRLFGNYEGTVTPALAINANGAARFAAIGSLFGISAIGFHGLKLRSLPWTVVTGALLILLAYTQSRTGLAAFALAVVVAVALYAGWKLTLASVAGLGVAGAALVGPGALAGYLSRGQTFEQLASLTGRTNIWGDVATAAFGSPLWGYGFHADRLVVGVHTHNAWLQAFIQAGAIGLPLFIAAWFLAVRGAIQAGALSGFRTLPDHERPTAILASSILIFLLIRSIPESTAAFYGVDLLIFVPAAAYLHALGGRDRAPTSASRAPQTETDPLTVQDRDPRRVLACAYACAPPGSPTFHGGEELLGWRMVQQIARRNTVHVLVSDEHRESIEAHRAEHPDPTIRYHYVSLPDRMAWMREHQGTIQLYAYLWQVKAYLKARRLTRRFDFDLFHHITYANDWMASHAGALLDLPYVRGPGGGAHHIPSTFQQERGTAFQAGQRARRVLQNLLRRDPFFLMGHERARRLLVCNMEAHEALPPRWRAKAERYPVTGIEPTSIQGIATTRGSGNGFTATTAGTLRSVKSFDLTIRGFARYLERGASRDARLVILGDGPERGSLEALAHDLGVTDHMEFAGWQDHEALLERVSASDVFLFTSLRDGGGAVVVEAMATGTPVICFDHAGPGMHVEADTGVTIEPTDPEEATEEIAETLAELAQDPEKRRRMGKQARQRALEHYGWDVLGDRMERVYEEALAGEPGA